MANGLQKSPRGQMVAHSIISAEAVACKLLPKYGLDAHSCVLLARGINDTYLVSKGTRRFALRLYRANWRTRAEIEAELDAIGRLAADGLSVSVPIADTDGGFIHRLLAPEGPRQSVLFSFAEGRNLDRENPEHLALLGRFAAELHNLAERFGVHLQRPALGIEHLIDAPMRRLRSYLERDPAARGLFEYAAAFARARLVVLPEPLLGVCHGDLQTRNAHITGRGGLTVFDFDLCGYGWRCFDFASVLRDIGGFNTVWDAFIGAYMSARGISAEEARAIPVLWVARTIWELGLQAELVHEIGHARLMALIEFERARIGKWITAHCLP